MVAAMEKSVDQVTSLNTSLQLEKDILDDYRLHRWEQHKKLVREEGFANDFNDWFFSFIANDREYTFQNFDSETHQRVKDFRVRKLPQSKIKGSFLALTRMMRACLQLLPSSRLILHPLHPIKLKTQLKTRQRLKTRSVSKYS